MIALRSITSKLFQSPIAVFLLLALIFIAAANLKSCATDVGTALGFDTKENIKKELVVQKQNNAVLVDTVKNKEKAIVVVEETSKNIEKALVNVEEKSNKVDKEVAKVKDRVVKKVEEIKASTLPEETKEVKIAETQIRGIWDVYCQNNADSNCQLNTTPLNNGA